MDGFIRIQFKKWTQMQTSNETKDELYSKAQTQTPQTWKNHEKAKRWHESQFNKSCKKDWDIHTNSSHTEGNQRFKI